MVARHDEFASQHSLLHILAPIPLWLAGSPLTIGDQFVAGLGAGVAASMVACPTELIKCRLQAQTGTAPGNTASSVVSTPFYLSSTGEGSQKQTFCLMSSLSSEPDYTPSHTSPLRPICTNAARLFGVFRSKWLMTAERWRTPESAL